jgi:long-chain fatty acid transport protein
VLDALPDGRLEIEDTTVGFGGLAAVMLEPTPRTRVGATYRSEISLDFEDALKTQGLGPGLQALLSAAGLLGGDTDFDLDIPQEVMVSVYHELDDRFALVANAGWQDWSAFGEYTVSITATNTRDLVLDRELDDTWHVAGGVHYKPREGWLLMAGIAYDSSPVSKSDRTPDLPVDEQFRYAAGARWEPKPGWELGFGYEYVDLCRAPLDVSRGPLAGRLEGDYERNAIHILLLNSTIRF